MPISGKLSDWSQSDLTKYIRDLFQNAPPDFLPYLKAEEVQVYSKLVIRKDLEWAMDRSYRFIGSTAGAPAFQNSWVNYGSGYMPASFWKDPFGHVHLRGLIKSGTINTAAFTLPPGYRPEYREVFSAVANAAVAQLDVNTAGQVIPVAGSTTWFSLSGITFKAA